MDAIIETAAGSIAMALGGLEGAGVESAALVAGACIAFRWLWLGIRADIARLRGARRRRDAARGAHEEAFDRGLRQLLAECEARREPTLAAYRRAA